ncbi:MAG TPA: M3 family metallopeptidase [Gammaproteobacteria bacterium]|jgi:oligopeptidase A|nr:M3 family metallopeptidase [Gammaproteobacteria bacterium]
MTFRKEDLPAFSKIDPLNIKETVEAALAKNQTALTQLLSQAPDTFSWKTLMAPLEKLQNDLNKVWSPIGHLHSVMESEALRKAYNDTLPLVTAYYTALSQNAHLYQAILNLYKSNSYKDFSDAQRKTIENELRDFKLAGIHLPPAEKEAFAALQQQHSQQTTRFSENLLDATHGFSLAITDKAVLSGLPDYAIQLAANHAKQKNLEGYLLTLDYPTYSTAMKFLKDRSLRKKLYEAYVTRASDQGPHAGKWDNTAVMHNILNTRHSIAKLVGFQNYGEYSLATKMAKKPEEVLNFLEDLAARSRPFAETEYKELQAFAERTDHVTDLAAWDVAYYSEKLCEATFEFSQEEIRPYFPIEKVMQGMFGLVNKIYGITIRPVPGVDVWHPDVTFYTIHDENNKLRGGIYVDLYARTHKKDGAWMDDHSPRHRSTTEELQYPIAFLVCNFMPPVDHRPALLTHDDVLTLFHEFGHCLHHLLTQVDNLSVSGIHGVPWDTVEFPSQFMENFCWEKEILNALSSHVETGEPLPDTLYKKMLDAKHFQSGLQMIRQIEFSLFDFLIHLKFNPEEPDQIQSVLDSVRKQYSIVQPPAFNRFQHSFSHIFAGGYAAGYYSYKWAEVLSADAYAQFEEKGIFDHQTGLSFLKNILEVGGVPDPMTAFIAFRGRKPTIDALLKHNGMATIS